jgi:hypothetical protein
VILRAGVAVSIAEKSGIRIEAAGLERSAEDITGRVGPLALLDIVDHVTSRG